MSIYLEGIYVNESLYTYSIIISHRLDQKQHYVDICKQQQIASGNLVLLVLH